MFAQNIPTVPASTRWTKYKVGGIVLAIVTLASSVFFLIGCMSPALRYLAIYRVDVAELAHQLTNPTALGPSKSTPTKTDLLHPALPPYWFYGLSGICDFYTDSARTSAEAEAVCRQEFPPNQHVLHVVEASLRSGLARGLNGTRAAEDQETVVRGVLSSWEAALKSSTRLSDNEARVAVQGKASAVLVIVAILLDFPSWGIAFVFGVHPKGRRLADLLGLSSMVSAGAAAACAVLAMNGGMHGVVSGIGNVSGSLVFLVIGALLRIPVVELLLPRLPPPPPPPKLDRRQIGALGEAFMLEWFQHFLPDFSVQHWSSRMYPTQQGRFADFTYTDHQGYMGAALQGAGVSMMPYWGRGTTYHIEVKSTQGECNSASMFFSPNQIDMMKRLNDGPEAYIVARVFRVGTVQPAVRFFPRPWQWFGVPHWPPAFRCDLRFDYNHNHDDDTRVWVNTVNNTG